MTNSYNSAGKRVGVLKVDAETLARALNLPADHRVVEVHARRNLVRDYFEVAIAGPLMPEISEAGVAAPVELIIQRQAPIVTAFAHRPDMKSYHHPDGVYDR